MWEKIKAWFHDSETVFYARLQAAAGALIVAIQMPELMTVLLTDGDISWPRLIIAAVLLVNGFVTEYLRRRRAEDM